MVSDSKKTTLSRVGFASDSVPDSSVRSMLKEYSKLFDYTIDVSDPKTVEKATKGAEEVEKIINWTGIPVDYVKEPLLTFAQNTYSLRKKGEVEYVLSPRDLIQFVDVYRDNTEDFGKQGRISDVLAETIKETILIKYTEDPQEQELIKGRAAETFGVTL